MGISSYLLSQELACLLITVAVQAILISLLGFTAVNLLSKRSAPIRSLVCAGTIAALGLVLVVSIGFRSFDIAWTQPTLPVFLEENRANSTLFSEPDRSSPVETITLTNPSQSQISFERDMIRLESASSSHSKQLAILLILIVNFMGLVWLMGFLFQMTRLVYGVLLVKKFRDSLPSGPDASFNEMVRNIAGAFWKNRMPELYSSPKIESPITIGLINPIVIIPEKLFEALSENELKSILLHELAHIYHYDQVIGVIKRIVLAVHWWNPLAYIINREHEQAREEVSDNYVLRELHPKVYTQCLADLAEKVCLISNFPTAVGMAGECFSLPTRVEHILSKKRSVCMCTKIYVKTTTFATCLILTFGIAGVHGKVKSEKPGDVVIEKQENGSIINPVSLSEEGQSVLQGKVIEFEMIEKQDQDNFRVISNAGTALQTESSGKPALNSVSPTIVMAHAGIQTGKNPEKKAESVSRVQEPVLNTDAEDRVVLAKEEPPLKVSSDAANVLESRVIGLKSEDAAAYISRGVSCFKKGQIEDAIADFDKAIDLDPGKAVAYVARGSAYYELDQLDNAISDYSKAIEINPDFAVAYQNRGSVYYRLGQLDNAICDYDKAIEINPDFAVAYHDRGSVYHSQGRSRDAISDYSKTLELNPEDAVTYTCRGTVYFSQGRYQKAFIDFNRAIELNPGYANAYINRGSCYYTRGNYGRAIADYKKALELNPESAFAKKLRKYRHYDSALFLVRVINDLSFAERAW
jgi:tetratricopeptide (TPR) repeat protein/beta-lactamase regulating signal transducer with metallopeptidase domain